MADSFRYNRRKSNLKNRNKPTTTAVAEQSGFSTTFIGILIALLIGLLLRGWVSPEKIKAGIEKAASKVHKEAKFRVGSARLSLADGVFPELAVVVEDITIENNDPCYLSPLASVNQIKLPLSFSYLIQGKIFIHRVLVDQLDLNLREGRSACENPKAAKNFQPSFEGGYREVAAVEINKEEDHSQVAATADSTPENLEKKLGHSAETSHEVHLQFPIIKRDNPVDTIEINDLRVHYEPMPFTTLQFSDLGIKLNSAEPKEVETTGIIRLGGETLSGDYSSRANLSVLYRESEEPALAVKIHGTWREGHYGLDLNLDKAKKTVAISSELKHIPLSQIFPVLKKYGFMNSDFNGRQTWFSGSLNTEISLDNWRSSQVVIKAPRLEGDFGEISSEQLRFLSLEPVRIEPAFLAIKAFDVDKFLTFLNRQHPSPALGKLGVFNGTAKFFSPDDIEIDGEHSGLEFVFSNRGVREIQPIGLIVASFKLLKGFWNIQLHKVRPVEGVFDGKIQLKADQGWKDIQVQTRIDELTLSPKVQTLMTAGGGVGSLYGDLQLELLAGELKNMKGNLKFTDLSLEGITLSRPSMLINTEKEGISVLLAAKEMQLQMDSPAAREIQVILPEEIKSLEKIQIRSPSISVLTDRLKTMEWTNLQAKFENYRLSSSGGWDQEGRLHGKIQIQGQQQIKLWSIEGLRDQYQIVESR